MEYELKAKITKKQMMELLQNKLPFNPDFSKFIMKQDTYYSFNGVEPYLPKEFVRVREEEVYSFKEIIKEISSWNQYEEENKKVLEDLTDKLISLLKGKGLNIGLCFVGTKPSCKTKVLTVKEKNTIGDHEENKEFEGELPEDTSVAFFKVLKMASFKPYFSKNKNSISFYVEDGLHCEIVSVNSSDIYLEVECCTDEPTIPTPIDKIKKFMNNLGITEFDTRSWKDIVSDE